MAALDSGPILDDYQFYLDYNGQKDGPRQMPETIDFGNGLGPQLPLIKVFGEEATQTSWPNRGTAGGAFTGVNIRPQDLNRETPFRDETVKGVRCYTETGIGRYYDWIDAVLADITTEDIYFEAVYAREIGTVAPACIFGKRNQGSSTNVGYQCSATTGSTMTWTMRAAGDAVRSAQLTTTSASFCHVSGYLNNDVSGTERARAYVGSQTTVNAPTATTLGSLTNAIPLRLGANWLSSYTGISDITIIYLAIWIGNDMMTAAPSAALLQEIRNRQMWMAGIVPQVGVKSMLTLTEPARHISRKRNGKLKVFRKGIGFCVTEDKTSALDGEIVTGLEMSSALNATAFSSENYSAWTATNCSLTTDAVDAPCQPVVAFQGTGMVAATSAPSSIDRVIAQTAATRPYFSCFMKKGAGNFGYFSVGDTAGNATGRYAYFDLTTGAVTLGPGAVWARAIPYDGDWWHVAMLTTNTVADASTVLSLGFSAAAGSTAVTGDGSTITGYLWSMQYVVASAAYLGQMLPIVIDMNVSGPIHTYDGTSITQAPGALLWEMISTEMSNSPLAALTGLMLYTDNNNYTGVGFTNATSSYTLSASGVGVGTTQFNLTPVIFAAAGPGNGKRNRFLVSLETNDIKVIRGDNYITATDSVSTLPTSFAQIRCGNSAAGAVGGRCVMHTRFGVTKSPRITNNGPKRIGEIEGHENYLSMNDASGAPIDTITGEQSTTSGTVTAAQPGVDGRAMDIINGYIETNVRSMTGAFAWAMRTTIKSALASGEKQIIFDQQVPGTTTIANGIIVGVDDLHRVYLFLGASTVVSTRTITPGTPFVIAVVCTGIAIQIFVNGVLFLTATNSGGFMSNQPIPLLRIGGSSRSGQTFSPSNLRVEKLRVFNYDLSTTKIAALYGQPWSPSMLYPSFWVKSDPANVTLDGSDGVSQFTDLSGNNFHALQTTPANRPIFGVSGANINGKPTLRFTRANATFLTMGDVMDLTGTGIISYSYAAVLRRRMDGVGQGILGKNIAASTDGRYGLFFDGSGNYQGIYDQDATASGTITVAAEPINVVTGIVDVCNRRGATSVHELRQNRVKNVLSFTDVSSGWNTTAPWAIGRYGVSTGFDAEMDLAEIIFSLRVWNNEEEDQIENYFTSEWGTP